MKKEIRAKLLKRRKELTTYEVLKKSNEVIANLKKLNEFKNAKKIACYISFNNEVYTHGLIKEYINKKEVLVPFIDREKKEIKLACIKSWKELEQGAYGILEPKKEALRIRDYSHIDVILVPGLAAAQLTPVCVPVIAIVSISISSGKSFLILNVTVVVPADSTAL